MSNSIGIREAADLLGVSTLTLRRWDQTGKLPAERTDRFHLIGIEDLNVAGMAKNHSLALDVLDQGFYEFKRQLRYKALGKGGLVVTADRWFASTKTCFDCKFVLPQLDLGTRVWTCPCCRVVHDRDINAAKNLEAWAVSSTVTACGEASSGSLSLQGVKLASMKQELDGKTTYSSLV